MLTTNAMSAAQFARVQKMDIYAQIDRYILERQRATESHDVYAFGVFDDRINHLMARLLVGQTTI